MSDRLTFILFLFTIATVLHNTMVVGVYNDAQAAIVDRMLAPSNYNKLLKPPTDNYEPTLVNATMYITHVGSLSESDMTFKMQFYFRQYWNDRRLDFSNETGRNGVYSKIVLSPEMVESMWTPDSFFPTEVTQSFIHENTIKNIFVRVHSNGDILMSYRITVTSQCPMDLSMFPLDVQICSLKVASWAYTADDLVYSWLEKPYSGYHPVLISDDITLTNFQLLNLTQRNYMRHLSTGSWSYLDTSLVFGRNTFYYITQFYIPSSLVVITSWISFWVPRRHMGARAAISLLALLTLFIFTCLTNESMPTISYLRAIDVYFGACFLFLFGTLLHFALVGYYMDRQMWNTKCRTNKENKTKKREKKGKKLSPKKDIEMELCETDLKPGKSDCPSSSAVHHDDEITSDTDTDLAYSQENECEQQNYGPLDVFARYAFPLAFVGMVFGYWAHFLTRN